MEKQKFERFRGSTIRLPLQLLDKDGAPIDISEDDLVFSLKLDDIVTATSAHDDTPVPEYDPEAIIIERDNDTATIVPVIGHKVSDVAGGTYPFDLWRYNADETRKAVILADLVIHEAVTHDAVD